MGYKATMPDRPLITTLMVLLACSSMPGAASAQALSGAPGKPNIVGTPQTKQKIAPPPAVPGATARPGTVSPADRTAADLPPTEALFDAINRGDIGTARDAVARGADIDATNLVGLTPLELSVDLSRNDITFLLLSLRNGSAKPTTSKQAGSASSPALNAKAPPRLQVARPLKGSSVASAAVDRPPVYRSGDGGSATPEAGFLGFNANR